MRQHAASASSPTINRPSVSWWLRCNPCGHFANASNWVFPAILVSSSGQSEEASVGGRYLRVGGREAWTGGILTATSEDR